MRLIELSASVAGVIVIMMRKVDRNDIKRSPSLTCSPVPFTIHATITRSSDVATLLELLDEALLTISTNIAIKHVIVSGLESSPADSSTATPSKKLPKSQVRVSWISHMTKELIPVPMPSSSSHIPDHFLYQHWSHWELHIARECAAPGGWIARPPRPAAVDGVLCHFRAVAEPMHFEWQEIGYRYGRHSERWHSGELLVNSLVHCVVYPIYRRALSSWFSIPCIFILIKHNRLQSIGTQSSPARSRGPPQTTSAHSLTAISTPYLPTSVIVFSFRPLQGVPSRRQLHSQHRALSRALMDAELQSLRRKGPAIIARLQERAAKLMNGGGGAGDKETSGATGDRNGDHVRVRLAEVMTIYGEVDRAAKRLEYLTEQRRECLREMTRQRALEDEINDVSNERGQSKFLFLIWPNGRWCRPTAWEGVHLLCP